MRSELSRCGVLAVGLLLGLAGTLRADPLVVKTQRGRLHGKTIGDGAVRAWLGVRYAAAPTGGLRWKAPQPAVAWKGLREATQFGARCVQTHASDDMVFQDAGPNEDCLFLNVYAPAGTSPNRRLPVMFWIHGGGFSAGSSDEPRHNGGALPRKEVILVTINYRLGVFGFLATADLAREAHGAAGNYGLMDMIAGLQWVKSNIRSFGGDPTNVTIFGESAGSFAVSTLMASPLAAGLFEKAIGESGGALGSSALPYDTLAVREEKDGKWVAGLHTVSLADLRALPTQTILDAASKPGVGFPPDVDGAVLTEAVSATYARGKQAHVPLLAGWNADEGNFLAGQGMTVEQWTAIAQKSFGDRAPQFLQLYPGDTDAQALRSSIDFASDQFIAFGTWKWLEEHSETGDAPVFRYHFELPATPSKYHSGTFAFHSDDIEYVFGALDTRPGFKISPEDTRLSEQIMTYWTNFAKTGDPNGVDHPSGADLPRWPSYKDGAYSLIHLNSVVTSGPDTLRARYLFLAGGMPTGRF